MVKNKITLNVLADITKNIGNSTNRQSNSNSDNSSGSFAESNDKDKALVVFTGSDININKKLDYILELKKSGVSLSLVFSIMSEHILDAQRIVEMLNPREVYLEEDIMDLKEIAREYDYIVSPNITINSMSKLEQGLLDSLVSNLIWTFLYMDKPVYMDFESTLNYLGLSCKNKAVEDVILSKIQKVKSMGVIEIGSKNYLGSIYRDRKLLGGVKRESGNEIDRFIEKENQKISNRRSSSSSKKFYTENDIRNLEFSGNNLVLEKGTKLTPLARDKVRSMGISVKFE